MSAPAAHATTGVFTPAEWAQLSSRLQRHFAAKASLVTSGAAPSKQVMAGLLGPVDETGIRRNGDRARAMHGGYRAHAVTVTLESARAVSATSRTLVVTEVTTLWFSNPSSSATYTTYSARHAVAVERAGSSWTVKSVAFIPENPAALPLTQVVTDSMRVAALTAFQARSAAMPPAGDPVPVPVVARDIPSPPGEMKATASTGMSAALATASYNYSAMASYAKYWAVTGRYNSAYPNYTPQDCTNFVSQCLTAGGWQDYETGVFPFNRSDTYNWFHNGTSSSLCSYSWGGANPLKNFMIHSGRVSWLSSIYSAGVGDCIGYDWTRDSSVDHWAMCTGHSSSGTPLMTQHDTHYINKPLNEIIAGTSWGFVAART